MRTTLFSDVPPAAQSFSMLPMMHSPRGAPVDTAAGLHALRKLDLARAEFDGNEPVRPQASRRGWRWS
jgi:hypothetical protein